MKKILQINVTANWGSHGKIAEEIGKLAQSNGWETWIAYGRGNPHSASNLIRIGNDFDMRFHGFQTRLFDNHGLSSKNATKKFIEDIKIIKPDIIHLHNIHGYYLNYKILFDYLKIWGGPVIWTLHDCWSFTGHCSHYEFVGCNKWQSHCFICPQKNRYPSSLLFDRSSKNFDNKKESFLGLPNLTIVPVSDWLAGEVKKSLLKDYPIQVIKNGIDLNVFKPIEGIQKEDKWILGVASVWDDRKGLNDFVKLREELPKDYTLLLIGLTEKQIKQLPSGIIGKSRTENIEELVKLYNKASIFVNPTFEDTYPTTNLESLACGTPVITYKTGGSPEALDSKTGISVKPGKIDDLVAKIKFVCENKPFNSEDCRTHAIQFFDKNKSFQAYIDLYKSLL